MDNNSEESEYEEQPSPELVKQILKEKTAENSLENADGWDEKGTFRCQRQKILLTYPSHIPKKKLIRFIHEKAERKPTFIRCAHETGTKKVDYPHTHVLLDWGTNNAPNWRDCRKFDWVYENKGEWKGKDANKPFKQGGRCMHPNVRYVKKRDIDWKLICDYIAKSDPDNEDLKMKKSIATKVWKCETKQQALEKYCRTPSDANGILTLFDLRDTDDGPELPELKSAFWQVEMENILNSIVVKRQEIDVPTNFIPGHYENGTWIMGQNAGPQVKLNGDDRRIDVVYDPEGSSGKSVWASSLEKRDPKKYLVLKGLTGVRDMASIIKNARAKGWSGHTVFIDLTRTKADHSIYESLELIRDGKMMVIKYDGDTITWNSVAVCLLTNWIPDLEKVTTNRWSIWRIMKGEGMGLGLLCPVPIQEAFKLRKNEILHRANRDEPLNN